MATTDHASRRPHQGAGRHRIRRRVSRQCGGGRRALGSVIPHAGAIGALVIAMIEPAFGAGAVPATGRAHGAVARDDATRGRAERMAPITRRADRERLATVPTGLESQRPVHGVAATPAPDWTATRIRATTRAIGSVCRSIEAVIEGLEPSTPGPHLSVAARQPTASGQAAFGGALGGRLRSSPGPSPPPPNACQPINDRGHQGRGDPHAGLDRSPEFRAST